MSNASDLRNAFWEEDKKNGEYIRKQYNEIKRILSETDKQWVEEKMLNIKRHAIANTDFYKSYSIDDTFPVMTKSVFIECHEECKAKKGFMTPIHISATSGSTGTPFAVEQDMIKRKRNIADLKVFGELCDYPSHERMIFFRVLNKKLNRTPEREEKENIFYVDSSRLDDESLDEMYHIILEKKPRIVFSYASTLVTLANYIKYKYPNSKFDNLRSVLTAGEGISEENRKMLAKVFQCKAYRRYSDMELGILAQDMGDGGAYTLNWGSYYFECLKIDKDEPAEEGEVGRIVITDLFNYAFPMIRYDTGDLGVMEHTTNGFPKLLEIHGRVRDCVYTLDGKLISPAKIFVAMWGAEGIKQWQFIQNTASEYVLKLNADSEGDYTVVINILKEILGNAAQIEIEYVKDIPVLSSNKRRAIICNYTKE